MLKLLFCSLIVVLGFFDLRAATIAQLVDSIVANEQLPTEEKQPLTYQIQIPEEVLQKTKDYLEGVNFDLSNLIGPENCQDYLNAAKYLDFQNLNKRSTYSIRLACLLRSNGKIKTLEAFTTEPNSLFFQEVDANGNYLPSKKLELYQAGQYTLDFVPEVQVIQKQIVKFAIENMLQLSKELNFEQPTLLVFVGTYGAGKSYQAKHHPWMPSQANDAGVLSTDRLKRLYMQLLPGVTNAQVHHETVALRKQIMEAYLKVHSKQTLVMETVLNSPSEVESLLNMASPGTQIKIVDLDADLEAAILRILGRDPANGDPIPDFQAIAAAQKLVRETRKDLIERIKTNPQITSYELHYFENGISHLVAKKENGVFSLLPNEETRFQKALTSIGKDWEGQLARRVVSLKDCKNYGYQLKKVLGKSFDHALIFLKKEQ